jgi:cytochrome c oxidase assembly protein subunit 15
MKTGYVKTGALHQIAAKALTPLLTLLLILQTGIVVTGGIVRVTGSGLGCPTWPECTEGSITPVAGQIEGTLHSWIEFGNRLLTFALVLAAVLAFAAVLAAGRKDLRLLSLGQIAGIFGQAFLGGITVLTNLNPIPVAGHFLLSILLIAAAVSLRARGTGATRKIKIEDRNTRILAHLHIYMSLGVVVLGTLVTGSGPHAGDINVQRFQFSVQTISWLHADAVIALLGITLAFYISEKTPEITKRRIVIFTGFALAQGAIGYIQYFLGLPELIVIFHLLGSTLVWIAAWRIWLSLTTTSLRG